MPDKDLEVTVKFFSDVQVRFISENISYLFEVFTKIIFTSSIALKFQKWEFFETIIIIAAETAKLD